MADISVFLKRLDEQVAQARSRVEQKQTELQQSYGARTERYKTFLRVLQDLQGVAKPRLEKLAERCKFEATLRRQGNHRGTIASPAAAS